MKYILSDLWTILWLLVALPFGIVLWIIGE